MLYVSEGRLGTICILLQISVFSYMVAQLELWKCVWITVPSSVSSRWLPRRHLVGRWDQPRDASSLSSVSSWHAPYHHKLPHSRKNGTDAVGLPVSSGDPSHVKPLWPGQTWQEAAGPAHDLWHSLWVLLRWHHNHLLLTSVAISCDFDKVEVDMVENIIPLQASLQKGVCFYVQAAGTDRSTISSRQVFLSCLNMPVW